MTVQLYSGLVMRCCRQSEVFNYRSVDSKGGDSLTVSSVLGTPNISYSCSVLPLTSVGMAC